MSQGGPVDITANDGIEWRQAEQVVVARGNARAVRDGTTVDAARLLARYRPQGGVPGGAAPPTQPGETPLNGGNQIWRMEAEGNVRIFTATDTATGDRGVYDMDQAVLVLTGRSLSLATPQQTITARDSLEYWTQRKMAVARGNALVVTQDGRRISADTLVAYMLDDPAPPPARLSPARRDGRRRPAARPGSPRPRGAVRQCRDPHGNGGGARRARRLLRRQRPGPAAGRRAHHPRRQPGERARGAGEHEHRHLAHRLGTGRAGTRTDRAQQGQQQGPAAGRAAPSGLPPTPPRRRRPCQGSRP
jgi:lipopolysaccharide export system protein LptA